MHECDRVVNVTGYDPRMGSKRDIKVVAAVVAYDDPTAGETVMLLINQAFKTCLSRVDSLECNMK